MFIVDAEGTLVYMGGIDDRATTEAGDIPGAKNYVRAALDEIAAGKPVAEAVTRPYGCSVKYADSAGAGLLGGCLQLQCRFELLCNSVILT